MLVAPGLDIDLLLIEINRHGGHKGDHSNSRFHNSYTLTSLVFKPIPNLTNEVMHNAIHFVLDKYDA